MFLVRQAQLDDASALLKLARMVHSQNLPDDPDLLRKKISGSRRSFAGSVDICQERDFIFVLEDTDTGNVIGCSSVSAAKGGPGSPRLFFQVRKREFYSEDLQTGQVHITLQLVADESGPTEIGGLILSPAYRGHKAKLGSLLSLVRFHFMGLHPEWFSDQVIAEMMGPLTSDSRNTLWDYLGRRFINLTYAEADAFNRTSKEFITALFPKEEIYASLLPPAARSLIGKVCPDAEPAKALLERLGFVYRHHIDPFDGGPHLEAALKDIPLVRDTGRATLDEPAADHPEFGLVSCCKDSKFRAIHTDYALRGDRLSIPDASAKLLGASKGDRVGFTPRKPSSPPDASNTPKSTTSKRVESETADVVEH